MSFNLEKYKEIVEFVRKISRNIDNSTSSIIAVTKNHPISTIEMAINAGVRVFGENRVQEALTKYTILKKNYNDLKLHMIGTMQSNKVKKALQIFDYFHTLDRENLANEFSRYPDLISYKFFFIQVNTGQEKQKSGILPINAEEFIKYCVHDLKMNIIGLMSLPPLSDDPRPHFLNLKDLAFKNNLKHLSMGMSNDYKIALNHGATFIRIGSYFFGKRDII